MVESRQSRLSTALLQENHGIIQSTRRLEKTFNRNLPNLFTSGWAWSNSMSRRKSERNAGGISECSHAQVSDSNTQHSQFQSRRVYRTAEPHSITLICRQIGIVAQVSRYVVLMLNLWSPSSLQLYLPNNPRSTKMPIGSETGLLKKGLGSIPCGHGCQRTFSMGWRTARHIELRYAQVELHRNQLSHFITHPPILLALRDT